MQVSLYDDGKILYPSITFCNQITWTWSNDHKLFTVKNLRNLPNRMFWTEVKLSHSSPITIKRIKPSLAQRNLGSHATYYIAARPILWLMVSCRVLASTWYPRSTVQIHAGVTFLNMTQASLATCCQFANGLLIVVYGKCAVEECIQIVPSWTVVACKVDQTLSMQNTLTLAKHISDTVEILVSPCWKLLNSFVKSYIIVKKDIGNARYNQFNMY